MDKNSYLKEYEKIKKIYLAANVVNAVGKIALSADTWKIGYENLNENDWLIKWEKNYAVKDDAKELGMHLEKCHFSYSSALEELKRNYGVVDLEKKFMNREVIKNYIRQNVYTLTHNYMWERNTSVNLKINAIGDAYSAVLGTWKYGLTCNLIVRLLWGATRIIIGEAVSKIGEMLVDVVRLIKDSSIDNHGPGLLQPKPNTTYEGYNTYPSIEYNWSYDDESIGEEEIVKEMSSIGTSSLAEAINQAGIEPLKNVLKWQNTEQTKVQRREPKTALDGMLNLRAALLRQLTDEYNKIIPEMTSMTEFLEEESFWKGQAAPNILYLNECLKRDLVENSILLERHDTLNSYFEDKILARYHEHQKKWSDKHGGIKITGDYTIMRKNFERYLWALIIKDNEERFKPETFRWMDLGPAAAAKLWGLDIMNYPTDVKTANGKKIAAIEPKTGRLVGTREYLYNWAEEYVKLWNENTNSTSMKGKRVMTVEITLYALTSKDSLTLQKYRESVNVSIQYQYHKEKQKNEHMRGEAK